MRCIFVLDILNGAVVHALRGERRSYRPITEFSRLVSTSEPLGLLRELCPQEVYVADLNLITGKGDNLAAIGEISRISKTMADIGISLPGTGEQPTAPVFIDGRKTVTLRGPTLAQDFQKLVQDYIEKRFGPGARSAAE